MAGFTTLLSAVAGRIVSLSTAGTDELSLVNKEVVILLAKRETDKRVEAIVKGVDLLDTYDRDLKRYKPKPTGYNEDGSVAGTVWDKGDLDARNKLQTKRDKLEAAVSAAIDENEFGKLYDLIKGGNGGNNQSAED